MLHFLTENNEKDWHRVRKTVFQKEQGFQQEFDDIDTTAVHVTLYEDEQLLGCARCFPVTEEAWRIGRIAVLASYRGKGYGAMLLRQAEQCAKEHGAKVVHLDAQQRVQAFYERYGYVVCGTVHMDEHVPHVEMKRKL